MKKVSIALLAIFGVLSAVILGRTVAFKSRQILPPPVDRIDLDHGAAAGRLAQAIQYKTISLPMPAEASTQEFQRFHAFLRKSFPRVHTRLIKEPVNEHSLLFTWKGDDERLKPILLMAHTDVVPIDTATEKSWTYPPFSGHIADGHIWGRGTIDDKASVLAILEAVEYLLTEGVQPRRTVYLAFGHDEELGGRNGAAKIAELLRARGVELEFVLDEGMNILSGIIDGIRSPVALIGIAEKGYLSLELNVDSPGGHSSMPPSRTAIGIMSSAIDKLERVKFPGRLDGATKRMLEFLGPEMPWHKRVAMANLWLFGPMVRREMERTPPTDATIRTTIAPTVFQAGIAENVLPSKARAIVNLRVLPGESIASVLDHVGKAIDDPRVKISPLPIHVEASPISDVNAASFQLLQRTVRQIAPESVVAPALLIAATDSWHYAGLTKNSFRFLPITLKPEDVKRYHGVDERISLDDYARCVRFYTQLIRNSQR